MKYVIYAVIINFVFIIVSCKKEQQTNYNIIPVAGSNSYFKLTNDKTINDSTIILKWSKFTGPGFKSYTLSRSAQIFKNGTFTYVTDKLKTFTNADSVTFVEKQMPYSNDIQYSITALTDSVNNYGFAVLNYQRPNTYLNLKFSDALIDKQQKIVYLINKDSGTIISFNYATNKQLKTTNLNISVGYSALGSFGGTNNEIYVPTIDGWLYILDAATLTLKDKIYVEGTIVSSVVASNGKLFVSSTDRSFDSSYNNSVKIYDRQSKKVTGRTGEWNNTRLVLLENSYFELVDITLTLTPDEINYYKISPSGVPIATVNNPYFATHDLDGNIVQSFPDGNRIITSSKGTVYTKGLIYEKDLLTNGDFCDFAFNSSGSVIYCASANEKKVSAISYPAATIQQTFSTQLYPVKIFRDGNQLICLTLSKSSYTGDPIFFVEKINL